MKNQEIHDAVKSVANAITPGSAVPGHDALGGCVGSLTEAVMGLTGGLAAIAESINNLADAVRSLKSNNKH